MNSFYVSGLSDPLTIDEFVEQMGEFVYNPSKFITLLKLMYPSATEINYRVYRANTENERYTFVYSVDGIDKACIHFWVSENIETETEFIKSYEIDVYVDGEGETKLSFLYN